MGEAKRRKREQQAEAEVRVTCLYGRGSVQFLLMEGSDTPPEDAALDIVDAVRAPNAMRPRGWAISSHSDWERLAETMAGHFTDGKRTCGFDGNGAFVGFVDLNVTGASAIMPILQGTLCNTGVMLGEERVRFVSSAAHGLEREDGTPVADPIAALSGLVRLDHYGTPIVGADAPLALQYAALYEASALAGETEFTVTDHDNYNAIADHLHQLAVITALVTKGPTVDPGAWIDRVVLSRSSEAVAEGDPEVPTDIFLDLLHELDNATPTDPRWSLVGLGDKEPDAWIPRDEPGSGLIWREHDATFAKAFPQVPSSPSAGAEWLDLQVEHGPEVRAIVENAEFVARKDRAVLARDDGRGLYLCLLDNPKGPTLIAWRIQDETPGRTDPLMAETLAGVVDGDPLPEPLATVDYQELYSTLLSVGLLSLLPAPEVEPDYAFLALLSAHRRGLRLPDFLASLAACIRSGNADRAFMEDEVLGASGDITVTFEGSGEAVAVSNEGDDNRKVIEIPGEVVGFDPSYPDVLRELTPEEERIKEGVAASADALGGTADPVLTAMLKGIDAFDWDDADLERDIRLLRDVFGLGGRMSDLVAVVTMGDDAET